MRLYFCILLSQFVSLSALNLNLNRAPRAAAAVASVAQLHAKTVFNPPQHALTSAWKAVLSAQELPLNADFSYAGFVCHLANLIGNDFDLADGRVVQGLTRLYQHPSFSAEQLEENLNFFGWQDNHQLQACAFPRVKEIANAGQIPHAPSAAAEIFLETIRTRPKRPRRKSRDVPDYLLLNIFRTTRGICQAAYDLRPLPMSTSTSTIDFDDYIDETNEWINSAVHVEDGDDGDQLSSSQLRRRLVSPRSVGNGNARTFWEAIGFGVCCGVPRDDAPAESIRGTEYDPILRAGRHS